MLKKYQYLKNLYICGYGKGFYGNHEAFREGLLLYSGTSQDGVYIPLTSA